MKLFLYYTIKVLPAASSAVILFFASRGLGSRDYITFSLFLFFNVLVSQATGLWIGSCLQYDHALHRASFSKKNLQRLYASIFCLVLSVLLSLPVILLIIGSHNGMEASVSASIFLVFLCNSQISLLFSFIQRDGKESSLVIPVLLQSFIPLFVISVSAKSSLLALETIAYAYLLGYSACFMLMIFASGIKPMQIVGSFNLLSFYSCSKYILRAGAFLGLWYFCSMLALNIDKSLISLISIYSHSMSDGSVGYLKFRDIFVSVSGFAVTPLLSSTHIKFIDISTDPSKNKLFGELSLLCMLCVFLITSPLFIFPYGYNLFLFVASDVRAQSLYLFNRLDCFVIGSTCLAWNFCMYMQKPLELTKQFKRIFVLCLLAIVVIFSISLLAVSAGWSEPFAFRFPMFASFLCSLLYLMLVLAFRPRLYLLFEIAITRRLVAAIVASVFCISFSLIPSSLFVADSSLYASLVMLACAYGLIALVFVSAYYFIPLSTVESLPLRLNNLGVSRVRFYTRL